MLDLPKERRSTLTPHQKLVEELRNIKCNDKGMFDTLATFILSDRAKIVAPLVNSKNIVKYYDNVADGYKLMKKAINETLKLAGME